MVRETLKANESLAFAVDETPPDLEHHPCCILHFLRQQPRQNFFPQRNFDRAQKAFSGHNMPEPHYRLCSFLLFTFKVFGLTQKVQQMRTLKKGITTLLLRQRGSRQSVCHLQKYYHSNMPSKQGGGGGGGGGKKHYFCFENALLTRSDVV